MVRGTLGLPGRASPTMKKRGGARLGPGDWIAERPALAARYLAFRPSLSFVGIDCADDGRKLLLLRPSVQPSNRSARRTSSACRASASGDCAVASGPNHLSPPNSVTHFLKGFHSCNALPISGAHARSSPPTFVELLAAGAQSAAPPPACRRTRRATASFRLENVLDAVWFRSGK
jgi:hypothetical protein